LGWMGWKFRRSSVGNESKPEGISRCGVFVGENKDRATLPRKVKDRGISIISNIL